MDSAARTRGMGDKEGCLRPADRLLAKRWRRKREKERKRKKERKIEERMGG